MSFSNYFENVILDYIIGHSVYTPETLYVGLALNVTDISTGENCGELDKAEFDYTRVPTTAEDWCVAVDGIITNINTITFPEAVDGDWGDVTHFIICNTGVAFTGNLLMYGVLITGTLTIEVESIPRFDVGDLEVNID